MRKIALMLCAAMTVGMLAGCQLDDEYIPTGGGLADDTQPVQQTDAEAPGALEQQNKIYTIGYYPDEGFNPYLCTDFNNRMVFSLVYQSLFAMNNKYEVEPILCKSFTVSEDLKAYTIELEEAVFSDGTPLTAEDVAASLQYARNSVYFKGRFDYISEISVVNEHTVRVAASTSYENLPMLLTVPIVKKDTIEADMPIGSGPYRLEEVAAEGIALKRNQDWWAQVPVPISAESVELRAFDTPAQMRDAFEFDNIGIATSDPGAASYAEYRSDYELWEEETGVFLYLAANSASPVFSNPDVRRALTFAIDRGKLLDDYYNGFGMIATLPASPNSPFYHKGLASKVGFDPAKFEDAITKAGMRGQEIILYVNNSDSVRLQAAREIAKMLTDCGLVVRVEHNSTSYYREGLRKGNYDLYLGQTKLTSTMDLSEFFDPYGAMSYGGMDDAALSALNKDALENSGNYYNLHKKVLDDGQLVPILFRTYAVYGKRGVISSLAPGRDNVFYYSMGKKLEDVRTIAYLDD